MSNQKPYNVGEAIKKARKETGLSQREFARVLKVSDKTISSYEVGRALPSFEMMKRISRSLHKPISYFDDENSEDLDLQLKFTAIERELLEIKKILKQRRSK